MNKTIREYFLAHKGKVSDKWSLYLEEWDQFLTVHRARQIRILEIGIQNGGSLEIWSKFFLKADKIIGCDINPKCEQLQYDDTRIQIIVGDANSDECAAKILQQIPTIDIVIDDGSHKSGDIVRSFARYFPHINDGGIYIVEDLHASYWKEFGGGLHNPLSAMALFKRLADIVNYEHWRNNRSRDSLLTQFEMEYRIKFDDIDLSGIHSIEFINSLCIVKKLSPEKNLLGERIVAGIDDLIANDWHRFSGGNIQDITVEIEDDSDLDVFDLIVKNDAQSKTVSDRDQSIQNLVFQEQALSARVAEKDQVIQALKAQVTEKDQVIQALKAQVTEKDRSLQAAIIQVAEKDQVIQALTIQTAEKDQMLKTLTTQIAEKDQTTRALNAQIAEKERLVQGLSRKAQELDEIKSSHAWQFIQYLWRIRTQLRLHK